MGKIITFTLFIKYITDFSFLTIPLLMLQDSIIDTLQHKELVLKSNIQLIWVVIWGITTIIWAVINLEKIKSIKINNELMKEELRKLKIENDKKDDLISINHKGEILPIKIKNKDDKAI
jgi:hypothetical protein